MRSPGSAPISCQAVSASTKAIRVTQWTATLRLAARADAEVVDEGVERRQVVVSEHDLDGTARSDAPASAGR